MFSSPPAVRERGYISSSLPRRAPLGSFNKLRRPIGATMGQQRPGHARHLVGERHRHDLEGSPRQEVREPGILPGILLGAPQRSDRPDDENAPQVAISLLGDRSELLLAPGRILPRHQPDPGREIASRPEDSSGPPPSPRSQSPR